MNSIIRIFPLFIVSLIWGCKGTDKAKEAKQWEETEIIFYASNEYENPYVDVDFWVEFTGPEGEKLIRPGFWFGENIWKVRFSCPSDTGSWSWVSYSNKPDDKGLTGQEGSIVAQPYDGSNELIKKGLLRMSPGKRNVIHANGKPFLMVGDTPWAMPWRATTEAVKEYAQKRQKQGFNTALLMSLQPDRGAEGPRNRHDAGGFDVAFEDLTEGHITIMNPSYFKTFDTIRNILLQHGIVPVFQPVFHGFGWKGLDVLGWDMDPQEYARYCRYLVARYGAGPAMYLVCGDSDGRNKGVTEGGQEIEMWDAYKQPTGLHYSPFDEAKPDWWDKEENFVPHFNKAHQDKDWLDFQWCQTGHGGEHDTHKIALMYNNEPVKAVANGEPTYEGIRDPENGSGWWQGHEAWSQFTAGGTMGVIYGAGGLWNWKLFANEPGWPEWADSKASWKDALHLSGADYVGYLTKALKDVDITDIEKHPEWAEGKPCLAKKGKVFIVYMPEGGSVSLNNIPLAGTYQWFDPVEGKFIDKGPILNGKPEILESPGSTPVILVVH